MVANNPSHVQSSLTCQTTTFLIEPKYAHMTECFFLSGIWKNLLFLDFWKCFVSKNELIKTNCNIQMLEPINQLQEKVLIIKSGSQKRVMLDELD